MRSSLRRALEIRNLQQEKDSSPHTILTVRAGDANSCEMLNNNDGNAVLLKTHLDPEVYLLNASVEGFPPLD